MGAGLGGRASELAAGGQAREHRKIKHSSHESENNSDFFRGTACHSRAAAHRPRDDRAEGENQDEQNVIDQQGAASQCERRTIADAHTRLDALYRRPFSLRGFDLRGRHVCHCCVMRAGRSKLILVCCV